MQYLLKEDAFKALKHFDAIYKAKFPKATRCLLKDQETLMAFYDFPAEHWRHLRTSNPIESTFATVKLRTVKVKRSFLKKYRLDDGIQINGICSEKLDPITRIQTISRSDRGSAI